VTVEEYEAEAVSDLQIDVTKIEDYCKGLGLAKAKWARYLYNEECVLAELEERLNEMYREKYHYYVYEYSEVKIEKKSIDLYVKGDRVYKEAEKLYKKQKSKAKMVEQVISALDKQSFTVSSILKHMIWESGSTVA